MQQRAQLGVLVLQALRLDEEVADVRQCCPGNARTRKISPHV